MSKSTLFIEKLKDDNPNSRLISYTSKSIIGFELIGEENNGVPGNPDHLFISQEDNGKRHKQ